MPPFPSAAPEPARGERGLNLGCGGDVKPAPWTNMDGFVSRSDVVRHDLVDLPWPFADGAFDVVYAAHVLEHVPFLYRKHEGATRDVLFDVMEEVHRVLKGGGRLHLRVPHAANARAAFSNPQHYRFWMPSWFLYFDPDFPENYYSRARFRREGVRFNVRSVERGNTPRIGRWGWGLHLATRLPFLRHALGASVEMEAVLRKV